MSVHWVEINFSTNLVIARQSFQEPVEAELLRARRAALPAPAQLESPGDGMARGGPGARTGTRTLERDRWDELSTAFCASSNGGSITQDKSVIHCCSHYG